MTWILVLILFTGHGEHKVMLTSSRDDCISRARHELHRKDVVGAVCVSSDGAFNSSSSFSIFREEKFKR